MTSSATPRGATAAPSARSPSATARALLAQAREALGEEWRQEDADLLQELFLGMTLGAYPFEPGRQRAVDWLRARVQLLAGGGAHGEAPAVGEVGAPDRIVA